MKLERKHFCGYLPYGLKGYILGKIDIVTELDFENGIISGLNNGNCLIVDFKPILRPLSDLPKFLHKYKNEEYPILIEQGSVFLTDSCELNMLEVTSNYKFYEFLFKNHFDLFYLIEKGLAIDKNTIK